MSDYLDCGEEGTSTGGMRIILASGFSSATTDRNIDAVAGIDSLIRSVIVNIKS